MTNANFSIDTVLAGLAGSTDGTTGGLVPSIHMGVTHRLEQGEAAIGYARGGPLDASLFERMMTELDGGSAALGFSSGASAAQALLATLQRGNHIILEANGYYEFRGILLRAGAARGIEIEMVDLCDEEAVRVALRPGKTALIWGEMPTNPEWRIPDVKRLSTLSHNIGARLLIDATVATPIHCRPIVLGADIVLHSATKYLNGHGDLTAGALVLADLAPLEQLRSLRTEFGTVLSPFHEWLLLRGMRTLAIRMDRASSSALAVAEWLMMHPDIRAVHYPGLQSHPQFDLASKQYERGFGAMVSFQVGSRALAAKLSKATKIFRQATSLGSTESLIEHRSLTEGDGTKCPDDLIRLSVGLEHPRDLIADLYQSLQ